MNKKFLSVILFSALMVGTAGTFTSCKDYDDDIESLDNRVSAVEKLVSDLQAKIDAGSVITGVDKTEDGIVIKLSNGESYPIKNGTNGTNAPVWSIVKDANGDYWWAKDNVQTEFPARGEKGEPGNGSAGQDAKTIYYYPGTEETGKLHGQAEAGYWVKVTEEKGKDPLYEVQTTKWLPEGTLSAVWNTKDETLTLGNMKDENGKLVEKTISLTTKLKALVFIPDLYEDGVEATKYKYANGDFIEAEKKGISGSKDDHGIDYVIKVGTSATNWIALKDANKRTYWMPSTSAMYYHLNPLNAKLKDIEWKFLAATPEYVTTKAAPAVVTPIFQNAGKTIDGERMYATYKLSVEDLKKGNLSTPGENNYISIAALEATLVNGEKEGEEKSTVTSDYAAIMPMIQGFKAIAYTDDSKIVTKNTCKPELYKTAKEAIENVYTVPAQYNGGSIELADLLCIHHVENFGEKITATTHKSMSLAEAAQLYNLTLKFEAVHYISGNNDTEENAYSQLEEDGTFTPCYVNDKEESVVIPEGSTEKIGRSAIGRRPAVLVKLVDAANNVVLAGYIKLEITEKAATPDAIVIDKSTPQLPYLCGEQAVSITWKDMSGKILEELGMTKEEFTKGYTFVKNETYVADGKGGFIQVTAANKFAADNTYGVVTETPDGNTSTNAILNWTSNKTQRDQLIKDYKDRTLTLYGKYKPVADGTTYAIYVGIKISIAELPTTASYGNKRDAFWYPAETALADRDTVRTNVPAPDAANNVANYVKNLDDYFYHYVTEAGKEVEKSGIEFIVSEASKPVYGEIWNNKDKGMEIKYSYLFSAKNDGLTIGGKKLFVSTVEADKSKSSTKLYWGEKRATASLIATLYKTAKTISYANNDEAKVFLNLFGHNENKPNQQFAIIEVSAVYGDCEIELAPAYNFNARFLRPLDIESNDKAKFLDAEANGSSVLLGNLFKANDWRDKPVIVYNDKDKVYEAAKENNVNLYEYYGISAITLDIDNATCDVNVIGEQKPINKDVIKLTILDKVGGTAISNPIDIKTTNISKLNSVVLNYKNNMGNTKDFTIMVPVKVTYTWGTVSAKVAIAVDGTIANR